MPLVSLSPCAWLLPTIDHRSCLVAQTPQRASLGRPVHSIFKVFNQEMFLKYIFKLAQRISFHISLCVSALHKNMKLYYLNKTTSHISPGPPLIVINLSPLFSHLCNPYLFLLPKFFHLTLSLTSSSLLSIIVIFIILNICAPFYQNIG